MRWGGRAKLSYVSVHYFVGKHDTRWDLFFGGGVRQCQPTNRLFGGRLGPGTQGHLGYVYQTCLLLGEPMNVTKLESGFDWSK